MSSYSVKMRTRRVRQRAGGPDAARPSRGQVGTEFAPHPVDEPAARARRAGRALPRRSRPSASSSPRSWATAALVAVGGRRRGGLDRAPPPRASSIVLVELGAVVVRCRAPRRGAIWRWRRLRTVLARACVGWLVALPLRRCGGGPRSVRANASIEESRRFCSPTDEQRRGGLRRLRTVPRAAPRAAPGTRSSKRRERQLGRVRGQTVDVDLRRPCARGSRLRSSRRSSLSRRTMTASRSFGSTRHAAAEPLRVEDLQQRREAVRVAVVRRGRQEQAVLEPRREVADGAGDLRVDGVLRAAGRAPRGAPRRG